MVQNKKHLLKEQVTKIEDALAVLKQNFAEEVLSLLSIVCGNLKELN